jgi:molybdate transport system regulatory protein
MSKEKKPENAHIATSDTNKVVAQFRLRIKYGEEIAIGPGKIAILEAIAETGSISAAGRKLGMSYRRAWLLVDKMNQYFKVPVVHTATGGAQGGGTALTSTGTEVIRLYRTIEQQSQTHSASLLEALTEKIRTD